VKSVAPEDAGTDAPNSDEGCCPNPPPEPLLNPPGVVSCAGCRFKLVFPPAGEAGWLEPNANGFVVGSGGVNENGDD
jgi:hypothetical protein